jgi:hypothetical protein
MEGDVNNSGAVWIRNSATISSFFVCGPVKWSRAFPLVKAQFAPNYIAEPSDHSIVTCLFVRTLSR